MAGSAGVHFFFQHLKRINQIPTLRRLLEQVAVDRGRFAIMTLSGIDSRHGYRSNVVSFRLHDPAFHDFIILYLEFSDHRVCRRTGYRPSRRISRA